MPQYGFSRSQRLRRRKLIDELFLRGESMGLHPLRIVWMEHPEQTTRPHQVVIAVSKRNFNKAVDRNLLKRRIREAYRLRQNGRKIVKRLCIGFVFTGRQIAPMQVIADRVEKAMSRLP